MSSFKGKFEPVKDYFDEGKFVSIVNKSRRRCYAFARLYLHDNCRKFLHSGYSDLSDTYSADDTKYNVYCRIAYYAGLLQHSFDKTSHVRNL